MPAMDRVARDRNATFTVHNGRVTHFDTGQAG
jgi:hypothetical protein